jgi:ABC-type Fe3+-siderophore transport system permease subunit
MGRITMNAASLAANTAVTFTLTNNLIGANDVLAVHVSSGATAAAYIAYVTSLATGSCVLALRNLTGGALAEAVVLNYTIIHGQ